MLDYRSEPFTDALKAEMMAMADLYWNDVAASFHDFPPDPNWKMYDALSLAGLLIVVVGRDQAGHPGPGLGRLKGFALSVLGPHPHYACIYATVPLLFLHPDYRKGMEGMRLARLIERESEKAGAQLIMTHGGMHNRVYRLFEGMKYSDFGKYYVKVLTGNPNGMRPVFKNKEK